MTCPFCSAEITDEMIEKDSCYNCGNTHILEKLISLNNNNVVTSSVSENIDLTSIKKRETENLLLNEQKQTKIENVLVTTTNAFSGYQIQSYEKIVSSEVFIGTGMFSELATDLSDFLGTTNSSFEEKLKSAKEICINKIKKEAADNNSNAIVGLLVNFMIMKNNMIAVTLTGTAVTIEKENRVSSAN